jgi:DNA polymerase elongation subunit (family B)
MLCKEAALCISKQLKPPHNLEFEKAIFPFILLSKKRYHGHYYTKYGVPEYDAKSMGIVLKRRDNAPIVKHVFGGMIDIIMKEHSISKAIEFVKVECRKVLNGDFPMEMFIIAKTLRSYYKNPDSIAHNVLAQRIGKRDPGNKPRGNDRIEYVFIANPDAETQGDRIETPEYATKHKCKLDYGYYITNQICKPVLQIFDLVNKGANLFESLLRDYYAVQEGLGKITSGFNCINMLDRKNIFNVKELNEEEDDDDAAYIDLDGDASAARIAPNDDIAVDDDEDESGDEDEE